MIRKLLRVAALMVFGTLPAAAFAIDITVLPTEAQQQRYQALTHEFRCMQCQNNSIADSPVDLASELRRDVKEQILAGRTDDGLTVLRQAMEAGELDIDYVFFGPLSGPIEPAARELARWWAETMTVPSVLSDPLADLATADAEGCEFIALGEKLWTAGVA